jgi:hypothetical protein
MTLMPDPARTLEPCLMSRGRNNWVQHLRAGAHGYPLKQEDL